MRFIYHKNYVMSSFITNHFLTFNHSIVIAYNNNRKYTRVCCWSLYFGHVYSEWHNNIWLTFWADFVRYNAVVLVYGDGQEQNALNATLTLRWISKTAHCAL